MGTRAQRACPEDPLQTGERALHARCGMTGDGALVRVLALLDRDGERLRLVLAEQLRLLARDPEVVLEAALVRDDEGDLAGLRAFLREREPERVERADLHRGDLRLAARSKHGRGT